MTAHDRLARIARQVLRENYASIEDAADAMAAAVITEADGYAVVELLEPMEDRSNVAESLRPHPMWERDSSWTCLTAPDCIEFEAAHQTEYGTLTVTESRSLAAALLAAADAAERAE